MMGKVQQSPISYISKITVTLHHSKQQQVSFVVVNRMKAIVRGM
jgi:hypothetical protein